MGFIIGFVLGLFAAGGVAFALLDKKRKELAARQRRVEGEQTRLDGAVKELSGKQKSLEEETRRFAAARREFETRAVAYKDLQDENALLKRDLRNLDVGCRKLQLDRAQQAKKQQELDDRAKDLGGRYLKESVKWIGSSLNENNYVVCKKRLADVIERCRGIGHLVHAEEEATLHAEMKSEYQRVVREADEGREQVRIKAQMREEAQRQREDERRRKQAGEAQAAAEAERTARERERIAADAERAERERERAEVEASYQAELLRIKAEMEKAQRTEAETVAALAEIDRRHRGTLEHLNAGSPKRTRPSSG